MSTRSMKFAEAVDRKLLSLMRLPPRNQVAAWLEYEKEGLSFARSPGECREYRCRILEQILMSASRLPWKEFEPYLRRRDALGYSSLDVKISVDSFAAIAAAGHPEVQQKIVRRLARDLVALGRCRASIGFRSQQIEAISSALRRLVYYSE